MSIFPLMPMHPGGRVSKAQVSVVHSWGSGSNTSVYTQSSMNTGAAAADRMIYIVCGSARTGGTPSSPIVQLDGADMDRVVRMDNGGGWWVDIYKIAAPTGTTGNFSYNMNGSSAEHFFMTAYRVVGMVEEIGTINTVPADAADFTDIPVVKNGHVIGGGQIFNSSQIDWDGVNQDYTVYIDGQRRCEAASVQAAAGGDLPVRGRVGANSLIAQAFVSIY